MTKLYTNLPRHFVSQVRRTAAAVSVAAAALLLTASGSGSVSPSATVTSRLMAAESAAHVMPIASAANFAATAVAIRHWSKSEVTVHIVASPNDNKTPAQITELVGKGLGLWNDRFKNVTLHVTDDEDADINVSFVTPGTLPGGAVGKTDTQFNPETAEISHAAIQINERLPQAQLVQAVGHEVGHALGIQGHSNNKVDIMYPYAHLPVEITDRDLSTLSIGYVSQH